MKKFLLFIFSILVYTNAFSLLPGDIMFVGFNSDDDDNLAFLTFVDIPDGTIIYFSDREWNELPIGSGGAFNTGEGFINWTNDTGGDILAGSVIIMNDLDGTGTPSTDCGTTVDGGGTFNINNDFEVVYAYSGTDELTPTVFLSAFANNLFNISNGTLMNTGLVVGVNATELNNGSDIGVFNGPITGSTTVADIANASNWTTEDGTGSQSSNGTDPDWPADVPSGTAACNLALPIILTSFQATTFEQKSINLTWQTASEENNDYFSIEHSTDGTNFREIATQVGNGTTDKVQNYSFLHKEVENGLHYYRLKQVDFDGKYEYTNIVTAKVSHSNDDIFLTPNPTSNVILIQTKTPYERDADFQILNMQGQVVLSSILQEGATNMELNITDFPVGIYYLQLFVDNDVMMKKIIKQ